MLLLYISGDSRPPIDLKNFLSLKLSLSLSSNSLGFPSRSLPRFDSLIFMNSRSAEASEVSCKSGNNNDLCFFWILFCLLPKFLGTPFAYVNFLLIKAIDRSPSAFEVINP